MKEDKSDSKTVMRKDHIEWLLKTTLRLPKIWLFLSSIFVILSMFTITWDPGKGLSLAFQVTNSTAIFLALIWLPVLLGIFALVGGGVKTPAGEITSSGLGTLMQSLESDTLGVIIDDTTVGRTSEETPEVHRIQQEFKEAYLLRIPMNNVRRELIDLAERYNTLRSTMPAGSERTLQMRSLSGRMRALAPQAGFSENEIDAYLQSSDGGKRLLGLSAVRVSRSVRHFEQVLNIVDNSLSAYEQSQALYAISEIFPQLNERQKDLLEEILNKQRDYNEEKKRWIYPNSDRGKLSAQLLSAIHGS